MRIRPFSFGIPLLGIPLLSLLLASCRGPAAFDNLGIKLSLDSRRLSNGLQVLMVEDHSVPLVSYQTWFRVGSVDEHPGITGISHLFEHLMFKGTPKYGPKQFFEQLEAKGAEVNAFTTRDYTVYYESFTPNLLSKVVDMESDRLENLTLNDEVVKTEKLVVLEERRLRTDNSPSGKMQEALWGLAYRVHPYSWPVIGSMQDVLGVPLQTVLDYFHAYYQPSNAAIVIVGNFDADKTFDLIKKAYGGIAGRPRPQRNPPAEPEQTEERRLVLHDRVASAILEEGYHVTRADDDDSYALDVLSNILFEGTDSRAYRRLVDQKDMMSEISGSNFTPTYPGLFMISGTMKGNLSTDLAEVELDRLIGDVQESGVTDEEVKRAVRQLTVQLVDSVRTPHGLAQLIGTVATVFGDPNRFADDLAKYTLVKPSDVQRVARKYLIPNNRSVVTLLPGAGGQNP